MLVVEVFKNVCNLCGKIILCVELVLLIWFWVGGLVEVLFVFEDVDDLVSLF